MASLQVASEERKGRERGWGGGERRERKGDGGRDRSECGGVLTVIAGAELVGELIPYALHSIHPSLGDLLVRRQLQQVIVGIRQVADVIEESDEALIDPLMEERERRVLTD